MGLWQKLTNWWTRGHTKGSRAEEWLMRMLPGYGGLPQAWGQNRHELVGHHRGWNYVATRAICEEIAGMPPQVAHVRPPDVKVSHRAKALSLKDPAARREALAAVEAKYLPHYQRTKALTHIQANADLEPVDHRHPLLKLLRKPNHLDKSWAFFYKLFLYLELTGNAFIYVAKNRRGLPGELWVLPSHWVRMISSPTEIVAGWEVRPYLGYVVSDQGVGWFQGGGGMTRLERDEVIHLSYPNPLHPFDGASPLAAVAEWVDVSDSIGQSRVAHFQNGAFPGVVIEIDKEMVDPPSQEFIDKFRAQWSDTYSGVMRTKKPMIVSPGMMVKPVTQTAVEMDYTSGADQMRDWLLAAHRVPHAIVGLAEESTFAAAIASKAMFHENNITPKLSMAGGVLTEDLASRYADDDDDNADLVVYWPNATPVDPDMRLRQYTAVPGPGVTVNEYRRDILNLPELEYGDDPIVPIGLSPMPMATGEDPADLPISAMAAQGQQGGDDSEQGAPPGQPAASGAPQPEPAAPVGTSTNRLAAALGETNGATKEHLNGAA